MSRKVLMLALLLACAYGLSLPVHAADTQATAVPVPATMVHDNVLSSPDCKFQIGMPEFRVNWYRNAKANSLVYKAEDRAMQRFWVVDCLERKSDATIKNMIEGAIEGTQNWAKTANAVLHKTSYKMTDTPVSGSARVVIEGTFETGVDFSHIQYLSITDSYLFTFTAYTVNPTQIQDFDRFVASFKLTK